MEQGNDDEKLSYVYLRSNDNSWVPAKQLKVDGDKAKVARAIFKNQQEMLSCAREGKQKYGENELIDLNEYPNKVLPMQNVDVNGNLEDYKDMVELPFMHEAAILYNLKKRHINERPYTRTGDIVIAVNPYQWYHELYAEKKRNYYSNRLVWETTDQDPRGVMEPHVYEVSALSYKGLAFEGEDQSILVSGESGAGKTETVKICLSHIASTQRGQVPEGYYEDADFDPIVQRVVQSNPLLEAFGNAQTRRNDNSSRFGKYLQLQFDKNVKADYGVKAARCGLVGSKCEVYLLEKNRVVSHDERERNFHIFYQLLATPDSQKSQFWSKLAGTTNESFNYIGNSRIDTIEGMHDRDRFNETLKALELVGITDDKLDGLIQAICVVLQLGNIGFKADQSDSDKSVISTDNELNDLAELMGVTEKDLALSFTERTFKTRDETHKVPLNADLAKEACDALAKEAYQKAFLWLVKSINDATRATGEEKTFGTIGLLDIFGFEAFTVNRFEQLCINYANEKLQQKFTEDIFRNVQEEYEAQGIPLEEIWYDDNTDVLDLIEGRTGLLNMLNEECVRPKGNDQDFVQKALQNNKDSPCLMVHRTDRLSFGIHHYAGGVMYDAEMFVSKNLDTLPTDLQACAEKCSNFIINKPRSEPIVRRGGGRNSSSRGNNGPRESNIAAPTVWTKYKNQLSSLMTDLRKTQSRYIRCIKPNTQKKPILLEHVPVVEQLRCAGVVAGITISRSVFPNRLENVVVLSRYSNMWDRKNYPSTKTADMSIDEKRAADCKALMTCALKPKEIYEGGRVIRAFVVGKTKTYFRAGALEWLESNRMRGLDAQATTIQKAARGWLARNQGKNAKQRSAFEAAERKRAKEAEKQRKAELKREADERAVERKKEQDALEEEIKRLEKQIADSTADCRRTITKAQDRERQAKKDNEELEEQLQRDLQKNVMEPKRVLAQQEKKITEANKLISFLKKENKKVRKENDRIKEKHDFLMQNSQKLVDGNNELGDKYEDLNFETRKVNNDNEDYLSTYDSSKKENQELKKHVTKAQDQYMEQAEGRLELQKTMARILTLIQEHCKDPQIVEDTVVIALECETEAKSEMAALETETGVDEPGLVYSDTSDVSDSYHSDYYYDH